MINIRKTITLGVAVTALGLSVAATSTPAAAWGYYHGGWGWGLGGVAAGLALGAAAASPRPAIPPMDRIRLLEIHFRAAKPCPGRCHIRYRPFGRV